MPRQAIASRVYGTRSEVAWAIAPLADAATDWPAAQVRLDMAKAMPWLSPSPSAPDATSAEAGVKSVP